MIGVCDGSPCDWWKKILLLWQWLKHIETLETRQLPWDICWGAFFTQLSRLASGWHYYTFPCFLKWWYPPKWMVYNGKLEGKPTIFGFPPISKRPKRGSPWAKKTLVSQEPASSEELTSQDIFPISTVLAGAYSPIVYPNVLTLRPWGMVF